MVLQNLLPKNLAGVFSHTEVFSCINYTFNQISKYIVPYSVHISSYADTWDGSWSKHNLDGKKFALASTLCKTVRRSSALYK
ncbi:hypothetical protein AQUCO_07000005v1 [Aquilegia coerulea]|uniref:Uncharacterized protein n=1 Tax=Aquilegia coerulea TaxID=218851 RepID=A0A2G5CAS1_AQUCA|nr:hypothetical protein AQUCO_07000005v1 [Aquilegia coerulea]